MGSTVGEGERQIHLIGLLYYYITLIRSNAINDLQSLLQRKE